MTVSLFAMIGFINISKLALAENKNKSCNLFEVKSILNKA